MAPPVGLEGSTKEMSIGAALEQDMVGLITKLVIPGYLRGRSCIRGIPWGSSTAIAHLNRSNGCCDTLKAGAEPGISFISGRIGPGYTNYPLYIHGKW